MHVFKWRQIEMQTEVGCKWMGEVRRLMEDPRKEKEEAEKEHKKREMELEDFCKIIGDIIE